MTYEYDIRVFPQVAANEQSLKAFIAEEKGLDVRTITHLRILRKSIDARQRTIFVNLKVRVYVNEMPEDDGYEPIDYPDVRTEILQFDIEVLVSSLDVADVVHHALTLCGKCGKHESSSGS